jgi:hypothetical protein
MTTTFIQETEQDRDSTVLLDSVFFRRGKGRFRRSQNEYWPCDDSQRERQAQLMRYESNVYGALWTEGRCPQESTARP